MLKIINLTSILTQKYFNFIQHRKPHITEGSSLYGSE